MNSKTKTIKIGNAGADDFDDPFGNSSKRGAASVVERKEAPRFGAPKN
jgi:hypothetical protein